MTTDEFDERTVEDVPIHPLYAFYRPTDEEAEVLQQLQRVYTVMHAMLSGLASCRANSLALTHLEESFGWATKGILLGERSNLR